MGFYGNITNTSNTTFQFDRIYPNRLAMDANANNDGIFIGRYVLVEYQEKTAYPNGFRPETAGNGRFYFYSSPNAELITRIKCLGTKLNITEKLPSEENIEKYPYEDGFYEGEILQYQLFDKDGKVILDEKGEPKIEFYKCVSSIRGEDAKFELETETNTSSQYIQNFAIDEKHYSIPSKGFKGYDSTVWTKVSAEQNGKLVTKYVNIADLNSVVPTFDIAADAPTMTPITPHFDADSTNVYYKLHAQPQWGFRIAQTSADKSDETTQWVKDFYNPATDTSSKKYASGVTNGIPNWNSEIPVDLNAAIYFNEDGFKKQLINTDERQGEIKKHSTTVIENTIKIEPTGKSGIEYNTHNGTNGPSTSVQVDTQELTINLPAIGNMMSDAWDIIHGPNRDNARTDDNDSLKGRLDSFKAFYDNQIPIKIQDGTLVGSKINNAIKYDSNWEGKPNDILYDTTTPNFERDDAWIKTEINTSELKTGDKDSSEKQENNSGISIHHTFHATTDSTSTVDKNKIKDNIIKSETYKEDKILSNNLSNIGDKKDFIELYTPYVDAAGHVVGKNIETITLPYGYKTIKVENTDDKSVSNAAQSIVVDGQSADNTQDILTLSASNRWIKLDNSEDDKIKIGHEVNPITIADNIPDTDLNIKVNNNIQNIINIPDWNYDVAGHIIAKQNHKYILPFGYKIFTDGTNNSVADSTQDTFTFVGDSWLKPTVSEDQITYTHIGPVNGTGLAATSASPKFKGSFDIITWEFDKLGHKNQKNKQTITLPTLTKEDNDINSTGYNLISNIEFIDDDAQGQKLQVTRKLVGEVPITNYALADKNEKLNASDTINQAFGKLQAQINALDLEENSSTTRFISKISQVDGKVAVERAAAGTLQLGTASTDDTIPATSSLNNAFNITNARIKKEEDALAKEIQDRKDAIDALTGTKDYSEHFDTMKEIADWLDTNKDGVVDITLNVSANATAIRDEKTRAEGIEAGLQEQIEALQTWKETATEDIANLNSTISQLQTTIESLQKQIDDLKNPPQEPDEGGETV